MATAAQVRANRANARKSTGPRTAAGKERASQNAVKHGLLAREAVIAGEDPEEFEFYREGMLADLAPAGPVEAMLAERVVGLSWRLRRAERLQNAAFAALDDGTPTPLLDARLEEWKRLKGSEADRSVAAWSRRTSPWGRVVVEDFAEARVLDRLLLYERRIESSLYRTMAELRKKQEARQARAAAADAGRGLTFGVPPSGGSGVRDAGQIGFVWRKCGSGRPNAKDRVWESGAACRRHSWHGQPARGRESWAGCPCHRNASRRHYIPSGPSFQYSIIPPFQLRYGSAGGGIIVRNEPKRQWSWNRLTASRWRRK